MIGNINEFHCIIVYKFEAYEKSGDKMSNKPVDFKETKQNIFDCAKSLFYGKGYYNTSIGNISEAANVNRALVAYYFQSKGNLALQIVNQFNTTIAGEITQKLNQSSEPVNPLVLFSVETMAFNSFRRLNENYRRFMKEVSLENILTLGEGWVAKNLRGNNIYDYLEETYGIRLSKAEKQIYQNSLSSIISGLIIVHSEGQIDCSHQYIAEKECEMYFKIIGLESSEIFSIIQQSKIIFESMEIRMEKNFSIIIK